MRNSQVAFLEAPCARNVCVMLCFIKPMLESHGTSSRAVCVDLLWSGSCLQESSRQIRNVEALVRKDAVSTLFRGLLLMPVVAMHPFPICLDVNFIFVWMSKNSFDTGI